MSSNSDSAQRKSRVVMDDRTIWLAAGLRTPFVGVDGPFAHRDSLALSVPVAQAMAPLASGQIDFAVWGAVVGNLAYANLAREVWLEAKLDPHVPTFTTIMQCSTSMVGVFEAAGILDNGGRSLALVGGVESMTRVQIGLGQNLSDWLRGFQGARSFGQKLQHLGKLNRKDVKLWIPKVANRTSGLSMGEHTEITAKEWKIGRAEQDRLALASHQGALGGWDRGFFDSLILP